MMSTHLQFCNFAGNNVFKVEVEIPGENLDCSQKAIYPVSYYWPLMGSDTGLQDHPGK